MSFKTSIICLLWAASPLCHAGEWVRNSSTTISFTGQIEKNELSQFLKVYKSTDDTLILNSGGGHMGAALDIASTLIKNRNLTVVVQGMCASSCANYLFLAGHTKKIDHGIVGFHGNWRAMAATEKFKEQARAVAPELRYEILMYHEQKIRQETEFLSKVGVDQALFEKTQKENDVGLYDIYIPGPRVFENYGIHHVIGTQDMGVLKDWPGIKILFDKGPAQNEEAPPAAAEIARGAATR